MRDVCPAVIDEYLTSESAPHCQLSYREGLGTKPLVLIIAKRDLYRKNDDSVDSKIPKFGVKGINN